VAQEIHRCRPKNAFRRVDDQAIILEDVEHLGDVALV
jgi:hypothetical protein